LAQLHSTGIVFTRELNFTHATRLNISRG